MTGATSIRSENLFRPQISQQSHQTRTLLNSNGGRSGSMCQVPVFSKIDAKSGFLPIKLDYESSLLTTFNTLYKWLRPPFCIKSAPEIYPRIMDEMLEDTDGARAIMDDILIPGKTPQEHDSC